MDLQGPDHIFLTPGCFDAALAFYSEAVGWRKLYDWGARDGARRALLDGGSVRLLLAERRPGHGDAPRRPTLYLKVDDLDRHYAALGAWVKVIAPPQPTQWNTRWFVIADPDGNLLAFEQAVLDPRD